MGLRDMAYTVGPFITLIDCSEFSFHFEVRPKLLFGQIDGADQIVLTHTDEVDASQINHIKQELKIDQHTLLTFDKTEQSAIEPLVASII